MAYVNGVYHPQSDNTYDPTGSSPGSGDLGQMAATAGQAIQENVAAIQETRDRVAVADDPSDVTPLLPRVDAVDGRLFTWADANGRVAMWVDSQGNLVLERGIILPDDTVSLTALDSAVNLVPTTHTDTAWTWAVTDKDGHVAAGVDADGRFVPFRGTGAATALRTQVACIGDSLTRGYSGGSTWPLEDAYPAHLADQHPGITVTNAGLAGWTTDEIRIRYGILPLYLTPTGGTLPTSGPVTLTTAQALGLRNSVTFPGSIAGVPGSLSWDGTTWTFTRDAAGESITVTGKARFAPTTPDYSSHTVVLWVGRNDVNNALTGRFATVADHVVAGVLDTVEWLAPRCKAIVVCGTTQTVAEDNTHPRYPTVIEINDRLAALLPTKYLDIRSYLVHQAIYDAGLTPTQADLDAMAADGPPPQIWDNGSHYLPVVAPYVAAHIGSALETRGLI